MHVRQKGQQRHGGLAMVYICMGAVRGGPAGLMFLKWSVLIEELWDWIRIGVAR